MRWEIEINGTKIVAGPAAELTPLLELTPEAVKAGEGFPCVVDVRKAMEIVEKPTARLKELGVRYVPVPVTVATFSEQDMDAIRREFARSWPRLLVISQGGIRASFLALAHAARVKGWSLKEATESCSGLPKEWLDHLGPYLARHKVVV
jgi:hypothetical protein